MKHILIIALLSFMSLASLNAKMHNHALMHANPLPNLVRVAMKNSQELNITDAQIKSIKVWGKVNKPKMLKLVKLVMSEEKMLLEESLSTDNNVIIKAQTMLAARAEIIKIKTLCRENLKNVLSKEQYTQLVKIYKKTMK